MMRIAALVALAHSASGKEACFENQLEGEQLAGLNCAMVKSLAEEYVAVPGLRDFVHSRESCQHECFLDNLELTMTALARNVGLPFHEDRVGDIPNITHTLMRTVESCYPLWTITTELAETVSRYALANAEQCKEDARVLWQPPTHVQCNRQQDSEDRINQLKEDYGIAFANSNTTFPAEDCQVNCADKTVQNTFVMLARLSERKDPNELLALTGALSSCFNEKAMIDLAEGAAGRIASRMEKKCFRGEVSIDTTFYHAAEFQSLLVRSSYKALKGMMVADSVLKKVMDERKQCEHTCFEAIYPEAIKALYGKLGNAILDSEQHALVVESMTGAFHACYPPVMRSHAEQLYTHLISGLQSDAHDTTLGLTGAPCNPLDTSKLDSNMKNLWDVFSSIQDQHGDVKDLFTMTRDCQMKCAKIAIEHAIEMFMTYPKLTPVRELDGLAGAASACLPAAADTMKSTMNKVITEFQTRSRDGSHSARPKLYDASDVPLFRTSSLLAPTLLMCVSAFIASVMFVVVVRRRMSTTNQVLCEQDVELMSEAGRVAVIE